MNPRTLIRQTAARFLSAGVPDPQNDAALLLAHVTGRDALSLRLDMDTDLSADTLAAYAALCLRREAREPLQYITGEQSFLGRSFHVDARVLIPRPETELLAERAITALNACPADNPAALDLCCGSGCLCVSLALSCPAADVHGADLSPDALAVSRMNADALSAVVTLHQGDLFAAVDGLRFDVIVSNPPYIPRAECQKLQTEVMQEPGMALDGGKDGLDFYRRIANEAPAHLTPGGVVLMEVGYDQGEAVAKLMTDAGFTGCVIHPDYNDIPRMVEAHLAR